MRNRRFMCATPLARGNAPCADAAFGSWVAGRATTCQRACGWCDVADAASAGKGACADEDIKCETWVTQGECTKNRGFMREGGLPPRARTVRWIPDRRLHR